MAVKHLEVFERAVIVVNLHAVCFVCLLNAISAGKQSIQIVKAVIFSVNDDEVIDLLDVTCFCILKVKRLADQRHP